MDVLYVDDQLLVINKAPGVLAQPDHTGDTDVVELGRAYLAEAGTDSSFLAPAHRLDRPVSGVTILARTSSAARQLSHQFRERLVEKRYLAVVEGSLRGIGRWVDYVAKSGRQPRLVPADHPEGKRADLRWQALDTTPNGTLLQIELETGRPHQIRLQASHRGHPVVGDRRYGAQSPMEDRAVALHHAVLRVDHPEESRRNTFVASPPPIWDAVLTGTMRTAIRRALLHAQPPDEMDS